MFWSDSNRCRQPQGVNFLAEGISDEEGYVTIPDGEFEYLLEFEKPLYHLSEPVDYNSMRLINYISAILKIKRSFNPNVLEPTVRRRCKRC